LNLPTSDLPGSMWIYWRVGVLPQNLSTFTIIFEVLGGSRYIEQWNHPKYTQKKGLYNLIAKKTSWVIIITCKKWWLKGHTWWLNHPKMGFHMISSAKMGTYTTVVQPW
jgi:hypothetical protein